MKIEFRKCIDSSGGWDDAWYVICIGLSVSVNIKVIILKATDKLLENAFQIQNPGEIWGQKLVRPSDLVEVENSPYLTIAT